MDSAVATLLDSTVATLMDSTVATLLKKPLLQYGHALATATAVLLLKFATNETIQEKIVQKKTNIL